MELNNEYVAGGGLAVDTCPAFYKRQHTPFLTGTNLWGVCGFILYFLGLEFGSWNIQNQNKVGEGRGKKRGYDSYESMRSLDFVWPYGVHLQPKLC